MTVDTFPGIRSYTVGGTGPYPIDHEYTRASIMPFVLIDSVQTYLDPSDFTVSPEAGAAGNVTLSDSIAALYAGSQIYLERATDVEQGWIGVSAREKGLEDQLDRFAQAIQDNDEAAQGALRVLGHNLSPIVPDDQKTIYWDAAIGAFRAGPSITKIENARANADVASKAAEAAEAAARSVRASYADKSELAAAQALYHGQVATVLAGDQGQAEEYEIDGDSTATADGSLILELTGVPGRAISKRTTYGTVAERRADRRTFAAGIILIAEDHRYKTLPLVAVNGDAELASGQMLEILPSADNTTSPLAWDVPTDGTTDAQPVLQKMHDAAANRGFVPVYPKMTFAIGSELQVISSADMTLATFEVDASSVTSALFVGKKGASDEMRDQDIKTPTVINTAKSGKGWSGFDTAVGVTVCNAYHCQLYINFVEGFGVGLLLTSNDTGNVYNTYIIRHLSVNKVNFKIAPGGTFGWVNENSLYILRSGSSSVEDDLTPGHINIAIYHTTSNIPNNNTFNEPSMEGVAFEYGIWNEGAENRFIQGRYEASHGFRIYENGSSNFYDGGYSLFTAVWTFGPSAERAVKTHPRGSTQSGAGTALALNTSTGDGANAPHIRGYTATKNIAGATTADTDWGYSIYAQGMEGKDVASAFAKIKMQWVGNAEIAFGSGTAAPTQAIGRFGTTGLAVTGVLVPKTADTYDLGFSGWEWRDILLSRSVKIEGEQVVGSQQPAIADATDAASTQDRLNDALAALRAHGLIAT